MSLLAKISWLTRTRLDWDPERDAFLVSQLRDAGAVILGKTNTPEFGAGSQTYNEVFGETRNPYDTRKTCGGSSGGAVWHLCLDG